MLFPERAEANAVSNPVIVWPHKAVDTTYFCPNLSCLSDELLVRRTSSFRHIWLLIEVATDCTWLMQAAQPSCPHCQSPLYAVSDEPETTTTDVASAFFDWAYATCREESPTALPALH